MHALYTVLLQMIISGSEGTDALFQMTVDLATGEATAEVLENGEQDEDDDWDWDEDFPTVRMTADDRMALLDQFDMDRAGMPSQFK